jgi:tetratricopeptide (TPR) repeat protein
MFSPRVRWTIVVLVTLWGIWGLVQGRPTAYLYLVGAGLLVWGHFRYGPVWLAFRALKKGDRERAANIIERIRHPDRLNRENTSFYYWIRGTLRTDSGDLDAAYRDLRKAAKGDLRTPSNKGVLYCQLADLAVLRREIDEAKNFLALAKAEKPGGHVFPMIEKIEQRIELAE